MNWTRFWVSIWGFFHPGWTGDKHRHAPSRWTNRMERLYAPTVVYADFGYFVEAGDDVDEDDTDVDIDTQELAVVLPMPAPKRLPLVDLTAGTATFPALRPIPFPVPSPFKALPGPYEPVFTTSPLRVPPYLLRRVS